MWTAITRAKHRRDAPRFPSDLTDAIAVEDPAVAALGCGDASQAVVWLVRRGPFMADGRLDPACRGPVALRVPGLAPVRSRCRGRRRRC